MGNMWNIYELLSKCNFVILAYHIILFGFTLNEKFKMTLWIHYILQNIEIKFTIYIFFLHLYHDMSHFSVKKYIFLYKL